MSAYVKVDVEPDTDHWLEERRVSVGASEVAAVMGLSSYGVTPLDIFKDKLGAPRPFDPLLAWIGHQSEPIIEAWVHEFSGVDVTLNHGFMARSVEWPFLHATFDRVSASPFITWQFKTAHQYAGHHWDEGIPTDIRVQVQAEMAVAGTPRAAVVVWIGGRDFRLFYEPRDDRFIQEHLIPAVQNFWDANVRAKVPPAPSSLPEALEVWPGTRGQVAELDQETFDLLEELTVCRSDRGEIEKREDELKTLIAPRLRDATELFFEDRLAYTYRPQKGRTSFDRTGLERDHPEIAADYVRQGSPTRVIRHVKPKETTK